MVVHLLAFFYNVQHRRHHLFGEPGLSFHIDIVDANALLINPLPSRFFETLPLPPPLLLFLFFLGLSPHFDYERGKKSQYLGTRKTKTAKTVEAANRPRAHFIPAALYFGGWQCSSFNLVRLCAPCAEFNAGRVHQSPPSPIVFENGEIYPPKEERTEQKKRKPVCRDFTLTSPPKLARVASNKK